MAQAANQLPRGEVGHLALIEMQASSTRHEVPAAIISTRSRAIAYVIRHVDK
jgi:hypothetical protein